MMSPGPPPQPPTHHPRNSLPALCSTMAESPRPIHSTAFPHYHHQLPQPPHLSHLPSPFGGNTPGTASPGYVLAPLAIGLGNVSNGNSNYTNSGSSGGGGSTLLREQHSIPPQRQQQQSQSHHNQEPHAVGRPRSPAPHISHQHLPHQHQRADDRVPWLPQAATFAPPAPQTHTFSPTAPYDPVGYDPRYNPQLGDRRRSSLSTMAPSPPTYTVGRRTSSSEENYQQEHFEPTPGGPPAYPTVFPPSLQPQSLHTPALPRAAAAHDEGDDLPLHRTQGGRYQIQVRQQPVAARACGFGERDRRVIDPPPIVQLIINEPANGPVDPDEIRYPFNVVHCTLWSEDGNTDETALTNPDKRITRRLMGTLVSSPFVGLDEDGKEGCFFCFPDLSCRTHGKYRLRFVLMRLEPSDLQPDGYAPIITHCMSEVFTVYTAKEFPGMRPSTPLTKALKRQGCAISVKKGNGQAVGQAGGSGKDDGSGDDDPPSSGTGKSKRRRKT